MPRYRIHRIKQNASEQFRWAPHLRGTALVKPRDYDCNKEIEALTPYAAWKTLNDIGEPLRPGDLLEPILPDGMGGNLQVMKYIGFEPAEWFVPKTQDPAAREEVNVPMVAEALN